MLLLSSLVCCDDIEAIRQKIRAVSSEREKNDER